MGNVLNSIFEILNYNLFVLGNARITPLSLLYLIFLAVLLIYISAKLRALLVAKLLERMPLQRGARQAIGTIARYVVLFVGLIIILQTVGIDLTTFSVLAGAVGIGIGLGLQNIANNFISGLILLLERPINLGDRIEVGGMCGEVVAMDARSTRILTNDNIAIIVPNSKFVSEKVINWSYAGNKIRFRIPVEVTIDADVELVSSLLISVADESGDVAADPPPSVRCMKFDADGILFELRAWSNVGLHRPGRIKSNLNLAILDKFRQHRVEIATSPDNLSRRRTHRDRKPDSAGNGGPPYSSRQT